MAMATHATLRIQLLPLHVTSYRWSRYDHRKQARHKRETPETGA
jgi:hypothetical protein